MRPTIRSIACIVVLGAAVGAGGCETSEAKPSAGVATESAEQQQIKQEATEAIQAAKDYAYAKRAEFVKDMQEELATINRTLKELTAKVARSNKAAKADAEAKLQALRDTAAELNSQLENARNAQETAWRQVKADFQKSNDDLKQAVAQARGWLSDKIAP
jgi:hypothetical protein